MSVCLLFHIRPPWCYKPFTGDPRSFLALSSSDPCLPLASPLLQSPGTAHHTPEERVLLSGQPCLCYRDPGIPSKLSRGRKAGDSRKQSIPHHYLLKPSFCTPRATSSMTSAMAGFLLRNYFLSTSHALDVLGRGKSAILFLRRFYEPFNA